MMRMRTHSRWLRCRSTVICCLLTLFMTHLGLTLSMETVAPALRDPEYGRRLRGLWRKRDQFPHRPLVLVLGSSRAAMGIRPAVIEEYSPPSRALQPLVYNFALIGSGPILELLCLRRLLDDGVVPNAILLEMWPPFLVDSDEHRIDPNRVYAGDLAVLRRYHAEYTMIARKVHWARWTPWYTHRHYLMSQLLPGWVPWASRKNTGWIGLDDWGWLPGLTEQAANQRAKRLAGARAFYEPLLQDFAGPAKTDHALRELLHLCRLHDIHVIPMILPESSEFRSWYSPTCRAKFAQYQEQLRSEFNLQFLDCRTWSNDRHLIDGFHLTQSGAAEFSARLAREVLPQFALTECYRGTLR